MGVINMVIFIDDVPMNNVQIARNSVMDLEIAVYVSLPPHLLTLVSRCRNVVDVELADIRIVTVRKGVVIPAANQPIDDTSVVQGYPSPSTSQPPVSWCYVGVNVVSIGDIEVL